MSPFPVLLGLIAEFGLAVLVGRWLAQRTPVPSRIVPQPRHVRVTHVNRLECACPSCLDAQDALRVLRARAVLRRVK
jgi:hypothetical protein